MDRRRFHSSGWYCPVVRTGMGVAIAVLVVATSASGCGNGLSAENESDGKLDAARAKKYLDEICHLGPRPSGSEAMASQQKLLSAHFARFGAKVGIQRFHAPHPLTGKPVRMANLIVSWQPEAKKRVLLACHYDTRPYPDQDRLKPKGRFIGANDGASGVALFMEMAHRMKALKPTYGVDFVFFDAEEFVFEKEADLKGYFLGSKHFAREYVKSSKYEYLYGVLVDMVADRDLNIYIEKNSLAHAPRLTKSIWETAAYLRVREFIARPRHTINDDHIPLNEIAKIPTCDIIDFDYVHWHTTRDTPSRCSGGSLVKVARVLLKWLENVPDPSGS